MKKLLLSLLILLSANVVFAQFEKKIKSSDEDIQNPKKKINTKTWITRAVLYQDIYDEPTKGIWAGISQAEVNLILREQKTIGNEVETVGGYDYAVVVYPDKKLYFDQEAVLAFWEISKPIVENPLNIAYDAYMEAIKLDVAGKEKKKIKEGLDRLSKQYLTETSNDYSVEKYEKALTNIKRSLEISSNPVIGIIDTMAMYNAAMIAASAKDYKISEEYYKKAINLGYTNNGDTYYRLAYDVLAPQEKKEEQLKVLQEGLQKFPENTNIIFGLIDYYRFAGDDPAKVLPLLAQAKELDPNNAALYWAEGQLFQNIAETSNNDEDIQKATDNYNKSIELNPDYFNAYYGLGTMHYNRGAVLNNNANNVPVNQVDKYEALLKSSIEEFEKSLPYMLKAHELNPSEVVVVEVLKEIYYRLRNKGEEYEAQHKKFNDLLLEMK